MASFRVIATISKKIIIQKKLMRIHYCKILEIKFNKINAFYKINNFNKIWLKMIHNKQINKIKTWYIQGKWIIT